MRLGDFDFNLPEALIADRPVEPRDAARLLVSAEDSILDRAFRDLPKLLRPGDLLVLNDTKVLPARLHGRRHRAGATSSSAKIEMTLLAPVAAATAATGGSRRWRALARPAKRLAPGDQVEFAGGLSACITDFPAAGEVTLQFDDAGLAAGGGLIETLAKVGEMPLPPYILAKRPADARDVRDYQTVYAAHPGAVAAPTAGLHFTPEVFAALDAAGITRVFVTLHVGAGTFLPIKTEDLAEHRMHGEFGVITAGAAEAINRARAAGGRIVAVGTTALRLLESAADAAGRVHPFDGETRIFISPGYRFKATSMLLTNFHLPRSTLFVLVAAFVGLERARKIYAHAIAKGYRFYSYGDACLLERSLDA